MKPAVAVQNLKKVFKGSVTAVDNISFEIKPNTVFGLIGPNGSGKTTTLRMLTTILQPTSGSIVFSHKKLGANSANEIRKIIGYVPQGACLYSDLTIEENLDIFSRPYHLDQQTRQKDIHELLDRLGLADRKNTLVKNLSGGLAKRASIASALIHKPKILFFDEVTMGLDPSSRYHIWQLVSDLKKETTIILTTHYMDEAEKLCDQIAILFEGKIVELDSPGSILTKHQAVNLDEVIGEIAEER